MNTSISFLLFVFLFIATSEIIYTQETKQEEFLTIWLWYSPLDTTQGMYMIFENDTSQITQWTDTNEPSNPDTHPKLLGVGIVKEFSFDNKKLILYTHLRKFKKMNY